MGEQATEFSERAQRYWAWDRSVQATTRFFGAAALTNEVLAFGCARLEARMMVSRSSFGLMAALSRRLERMNGALLRRARQQPSGYAAASLDAELVWTEQCLVERQLERWRVQAPRLLPALVMQMSRIIEVGTAEVSFVGSASCSFYLRVLRDLRMQLGRPLQFAALMDRYRIGLALANAMRAISA